jgi:hypothetical protein
MNHHQIQAFTNKLKQKKVMTHKTNRQVLSKAVKELSDIDLAFLRERILNACDGVLNNKQQVIESMQNSIVSPHLYIECIQNIKEKIDF